MPRFKEMARTPESTLTATVRNRTEEGEAASSCSAAGSFPALAMAGSDVIVCPGLASGKGDCASGVIGSGTGGLANCARCASRLPTGELLRRWASCAMIERLATARRPYAILSLVFFRTNMIMEIISTLRALLISLSHAGKIA